MQRTLQAKLGSEQLAQFVSGLSAAYESYQFA